ncbi:MAG TPA: DUF3426 domain-containing protein [Gammaproteobacteria bacterium]
MYAQCPECLTFFHLKPSQLKAAQGRVRCSRCKQVFNALETLRDELSPAEIAEVHAARQREPKPDAPLLNEEYVGDLFDGLEYTKNEELGLDSPAPGDSEEPATPFDPLAPPAHELHAFGAPPSRVRHPALLAAGNLLLLLALAVQAVHWQRENILAHTLAGPYLAQAYEKLGVSTQAPPDLAVLHVSRTEVSSHPEHPRALHLTALLENAGKHPQPWPELRVDLQDRWGETVAARYFMPAEYLRDPAISAEPLASHARAAISLAIRDPGSEAVGFRIEPCFATDASGNRHVCASHLDSR